MANEEQHGTARFGRGLRYRLLETLREYGWKLGNSEQLIHAQGDAAFAAAWAAGRAMSLEQAVEYALGEE